MIIDNVIFEKGNPGRKDGIRLVPEGCKINGRVNLYLDGNYGHMIGIANLRLENGMIMGRVQIIFPERVPKKVYPSLGFTTICRIDKDITESKVIQAILSEHENEDETIPAIELP